MGATILLEMKLPIQIEEDGGWYISSCPVLDVYSQGKTLKKAKENIIEALSAFFTGCLENGTLDEVLTACGLTKKEVIHTPSRRAAFSREDYVSIPIELLANQENVDRCPA